MTLEECIYFANVHPNCHLATVEGSQPRIRMVKVWFADETGFYFQTATIKEFPHQLKKNPKAEVLFFKNHGVSGMTLRIAGEVEFLNDTKLKEKVLEDRPFLKQFGLNIDSPELIIFRIAHGEAHTWTWETNDKPKEILKF